MSDTSFEMLIQRYEMGQAYKRITAAMGPSPQLLAFVNYTNVTEESLGLESFDIVSQHEQIIAEIDADDALGLATESLVGKLKSALSRIKIGMTLNKHAKDLDRFLNTKLEARKSNVNVTASADFSKLDKIWEEASSLSTWVLNKCPKTANPDAWKNININEVESKEKIAFDLEKRADEKVKKVSFDESGWTDSSFQSALKSYKSEAVKIEYVFDALETRVENMISVMNVVEKAKDKDLIKVASSTFDLVYRLSVAVEEVSASMWQTMNDVAQHFEPKNN